MVDGHSNSSVKNKNGMGGKVLGLVTLMLTGTFALVQYIFPDPIIYLSSLWRPEYILVLIISLISLTCISAFIWTYLKNKYLFFFTCLVIYIFTCFSFFIMGREYYKPEFSDGWPKITAEHGSVYYRGVEVAHQYCDRIADTVACNLRFINKRGQTEMDTSGFRIVMKDGAVFDDHNIFRAGQKLKGHARLDLPQGVEANIQVIFYNVPMKYSDILKLGFKVERQEFGFKHMAIYSEQ